MKKTCELCGAKAETFDGLILPHRNERRLPGNNQLECLGSKGSRSKCYDCRRNRPNCRRETVNGGRITLCPECRLERSKPKPIPEKCPLKSCARLEGHESPHMDVYGAPIIELARLNSLDVRISPEAEQVTRCKPGAKTVDRDVEQQAPETRTGTPVFLAETVTGACGCCGRQEVCVTTQFGFNICSPCAWFAVCRLKRS